MKYYIIYYPDGSKKKASAKTELELIIKYDLIIKENKGVRIMEIAKG